MGAARARVRGVRTGNAKPYLSFATYVQSTLSISITFLVDTELNNKTKHYAMSVRVVFFHLDNEFSVQIVQFQRSAQFLLN